MFVSSRSIRVISVFLFCASLGILSILAGASPPLDPNPLRVGDEAPDFKLKDQHGETVQLSRFRGSKNVVIVFFPLAFTGG